MKNQFDRGCGMEMGELVDFLIAVWLPIALLAVAYLFEAWWLLWR